MLNFQKLFGGDRWYSQAVAQYIEEVQAGRFQNLSIALSKEYENYKYRCWYARTAHLWQHNKQRVPLYQPWAIYTAAI